MHDLTKGELVYQLGSVVEFDGPDVRDVLVDYIIRSWEDLPGLGDLILIGTPGCGWDKLAGLMRLWCHPAVIVLEIPARNTLLSHRERPKVITCMQEDLNHVIDALGGRPWIRSVVLGEDRRRHVVWKTVRERFAHRRAQHWLEG
jgi:hypothetical protein